MKCKRNHTAKQVERIQKTMLTQWDKLSDADLETLSGSLSDLQSRIEERLESTRKQQEKRWKKPLTCAWRRQRQALNDAVSRTGEQLGERAQQWSEQASEQASQVSDQAEQVAARAEALAKEQPLYSLLTGLVLGALVTLLVVVRFNTRR